MQGIKVGISACLLGQRVRYDGRDKSDPFLKNTWGPYMEWVPICPEVECGLPVPREPMNLIGTPEACRLVTRETGTDHTEKLGKWIRKKLRRLAKERLCGFVFKSRSPSCGVRGVPIHAGPAGPRRTCPGIFAAACGEHFPSLPMEEDEALRDPKQRENFVERIFVLHHWLEFTKSRRSVGSLVAFHTSVKLLVLAHSAAHYKRLGRLVAEGKSHSLASLYDEYLQILMDGFRLDATVKKQTNVLQHILGYFKKQLSDREKEELLNCIEVYRQGRTPLLVPLALLQHYTRKYEEPYLQKQLYLHPHPLELMLRNHS
jgi:uncharacterized protein YbgA (DUF1722 family)/uncharacterized protein YbbK (DUF523 family)